MRQAADGCEIAGVVKRDGVTVAARVEVRLLRTIEEESRQGRPRGPAIWGPPSEFVRLMKTPVATATAGDDGRFLLGGLAPATYVVRATALDGGAVGKARAALRSRGERDEMTLDLVPARERLRGRVLQADGKPWKGVALVLPIENLFSMPEPDDAEVFPTDAEGRFAATALPAGRVVVCAVADGGAQAMGMPVRLPFDEEYLLSAETGTIEAKGRILAAAGGMPIPGAEVLGTGPWPASYGPRDRAVTDVEGRFIVRVPSPKGLLSVRASGYVEATTPVEGRTQDVEIPLARGARIHGRVRSKADGKAVAGIRVLVVPAGRSDGRFDEFVRDAVSDADGNYEFQGLAARGYLIAARGAGLVSSEFLTSGAARAPRAVVVDPGGDFVADLSMVPGARVVGTVLDASGAGVRRARVIALPGLSMRRLSGDESLPWSAFGDGDDDTATDEDGAFSIDSLVPGVAYKVTARAAAAPASLEYRVTPVAGTDARIDIHLPDPRWVDVRVVAKETGAPIASANVTVFEFRDPQRADDGDEDGHLSLGFHVSSSAGQATARTDAAGRARVGPLGAGGLRAMAEAVGFADARRGPGVAVTEGAQGALTATVELEKGRAIAGRVRFADGQPAAGAEVTLQTATGPSSSMISYTTTDERGAFEFPDLGEGDHTLRAALRRDGEFGADAPAAAGAIDIVLTLTKGPGPHRVVARVLDPAGNPIPSARAQFTTSVGGYGGILTDGRVEFDFSRSGGTEPSEGAVVIEQARDRGGALLPFGRARLEGVRPGQEVEIRLPPERSIEGRVVSPDGKGIADARVRADVYEPSDPEGSMQKAPWMWTLADAVRTDGNGGFRIGHLGEGAHWIVVLPPPAFAVPPAVKTKADKRGIEIRAKAAAAAVVTVLGPDGQPVAGARAVVAQWTDNPRDLSIMNLFSEFGSGVEIAAGADGVVRLEGLDPAARYVLGIRAPSLRSDLAEHVDDAWSPADTTVRLAPGLSVAGVVRDALGKPVAGAYVSCQRESGVSTQRSTGVDGTFQFTGLGEGKLWIDARVYSQDRKRRSQEPQGREMVAAGAQDVVLVVR